LSKEGKKIKPKTANHHRRTNLTTIVDRFVASRLESHRWTHKCRTVASAAAAADDDAAAAGDDCCHRLVIWSPGPNWATDSDAAGTTVVVDGDDSDTSAAAAAVGDAAPVPAAAFPWGDHPRCCHRSHCHCHCRWNPTRNWSSRHLMLRQFAVSMQIII